MGEKLKCQPERVKVNNCKTAVLGLKCIYYFFSLKTGTECCLFLWKNENSSVGGRVLTVRQFIFLLFLWMLDKSGGNLMSGKDVD